MGAQHLENSQKTLTRIQRILTNKQALTMFPLEVANKSIFHLIFFNHFHHTESIEKHQSEYLTSNSTSIQVRIVEELDRLIRLFVSAKSNECKLPTFTISESRKSV